LRDNPVISHRICAEWAAKIGLARRRCLERFAMNGSPASDEQGTANRSAPPCGAVAGGVAEFVAACSPREACLSAYL
jgi:hypothetical protein